MTHRAAAARQRVSWFELFYDLILVATVLQGSHLFGEAPSFATGAWLAITLLVLLTLWLATTLTFNTTRADWTLRRVLTLAQMLALVVAALSISRDSGLSDTTGFLALGVAFACVAALYAITAQAEPPGRRWSGTIAVSCGAAAALCAIGALFPDATAPTWRNPASYAMGIALALAVVPLITVYIGRLARAGRLDREHLAERMGQLVIIALGESFADLVLSLGDLDKIPDPVFLVCTFIVVYAIWAIYFRTVMPAGMPAGASRTRAWIAAHALLIFGAIGTASGFAVLAITPIGDPGHAALASYRLPLPLLYVTAAFLVLAVVGGATDSRLVRVHGAATAILLALTVAGSTVLTGQAIAMGIASAVVVIGDAATVAWLTRGTKPWRGWLRPSDDPA